MRVIACVQVILDVGKEKASKLKSLVDTATYDSARLFQDEGIEVVVSYGHIRNLSKAENMTMVPKKVHFASSGSTSCGLAAKNTQKSWALVTCKVCLKRKAFEAQRELPL